MHRVCAGRICECGNVITCVELFKQVPTILSLINYMITASVSIDKISVIAHIISDAQKYFSFLSLCKCTPIILKCIFSLTQTCGDAEGNVTLDTNAPYVRKGMAIDWCATVSRLDSLHDAFARATHPAISTTNYNP